MSGKHGFMNPKSPFTHGVSSTWRDEKGIKKRQEVLVRADGTYVIEFQSWWDGDDKPVVKQGVALTQAAAESLTNLLVEMAMNKDKWPLLGEGEEE